MKTEYKTLILYLFTTIMTVHTAIVMAQAPEIDWAQAYGGSENDYCFNIKHTSDGGYILVGGSNSNDFDVSGNYGNLDAWVVKINASGTIEWEQNYGGSDADLILDAVVLDNNEGYVFLAQTNSNDGDVEPATHNNVKAWLFQTDLSGTIVNDIVIGTVVGDNIPTSLLQNADGDFVFISGQFENIWMTKVNAGLTNILWQKFYGGTKIDTPSKIKQTDDGGYILIGYSASNDVDVSGNYGEYDIWVIKTNDFGDIEWEQNYGGSDFDYGMDILTTADGGYLFIASTASNDFDISANYGEQDIWTVKINELGDIEWEQNYGGSNVDQCSSILQTPSGGYIISGLTNSSDGDVSGSISGIDFWVFETDSQGNMLWQKPMGGTADDISYSSTFNAEGSIVLAGQTSSNNVDVTGNHGAIDMWTVTLQNSLGISESTLAEVSLYPNPVKNELFINLKSINPVQIELFSLSGQSIPIDKNMQVLHEETIYKINMSNLIDGVYLLKVMSEKTLKTFKIIKN